MNNTVSLDEATMQALEMERAWEGAVGSAIDAAFREITTSSAPVSEARIKILGAVAKVMRASREYGKFANLSQIVKDIPEMERIFGQVTLLHDNPNSKKLGVVGEGYLKAKEQAKNEDSLARVEAGLPMDAEKNRLRELPETVEE